MISRRDQFSKQFIEDYRVEVIVALLIASEMKADFMIHPKGNFRRSFRKDVLDEYHEFDTEDEPSIIHWEVSRDGLYDSLPESLFHHSKRNPFRNTQEMIDLYRRQQEEEKNARNFFSPIEQSFYREKVFLELEEQRAFKGFGEHRQRELFIDFWDLPRVTTDQKISLLLYLLPVASDIVGNLELTQECLQILLDNPISIKEMAPKKVSAITMDIPVLGMANLGIDAVLGDSFHDYLPGIEVNIGPIAKKNVLYYLPSGEGESFLNLLINYFLPADTSVEMSVEVSVSENLFILNELNATDGRLGYTTRLAS